MPEPQYITLEVSQLSSIIINAYNKISLLYTGMEVEEITKALIENNTTKDSYMVRIKHGEFEELNKPHKSMNCPKPASYDGCELKTYDTIGFCGESIRIFAFGKEVVVLPIEPYTTPYELIENTKKVLTANGYQIMPEEGMRLQDGILHGITPRPDIEHSDQRIQEQEQDLDRLNNHFEMENEKDI